MGNLFLISTLKSLKNTELITTIREKLDYGESVHLLLAIISTKHQLEARLFLEDCFRSYSNVTYILLKDIFTHKTGIPNVTKVVSTIETYRPDISFTADGAKIISYYDDEKNLKERHLIKDSLLTIDFFEDNILEQRHFIEKNSIASIEYYRNKKRYQTAICNAQEDIIFLITHEKKKLIKKNKTQPAKKIILTPYECIDYVHQIKLTDRPLFYKTLLDEIKLVDQVNLYAKKAIAVKLAIHLTRKHVYTY